MISLTLNLSAFERKAREIEGAIKQVPFALANALNEAAFATRRSLIEDMWPAHVEVRNRNALRAALRINKAKKQSLRVAIVGSGKVAERLNLAAHAEGGVRVQRMRELAIAPTGTVHRGPRGVPRQERPAAVKAATPKQALRITPRGIFVGEGGRLHLKFALKPSARIKADVPFDDRFQSRMRAEVRRTFPIALARAMKTGRR